MLTYIDLRQAISKGQIERYGKVAIVRKNGKIYDYVLDHEELQAGEVPILENVSDVLVEVYNSRKEFIFRPKSDLNFL